MRKCRLCKLPIVEGEDVIPDPIGYWAWHPQLHVVCADGSYQSNRSVDSIAPDPDVSSRAMPRNRKFTVRPTG